MSTDGDGINAYFHCLIFYEQFTLYDIKKDFDFEATSAAEKRRHKSRHVSSAHNSPMSKSSDLYKSARKMYGTEPQEQNLACQLRSNNQIKKLN